MLRPYQTACIEQAREEIRRLLASKRPPRVCIVVPTGGGKTRLASDMVQRAVGRGKRALWGVHRSELVDQAFDTLTGLGLACGTICAGSARPPQPYAPVQVGTFQSLIARGAKPEADLIVFDEAHHAGAKSFAAFVNQYPTVPLIGLTATPERGDGKGLGGIFEEIVVGARIKQLIQDGHLVPANLIRPARKLRSGEIAQRPVDAYLMHARGKRAIVFSPSVLTAEEHAAQFRALGVAAKMVEGETPASERRATLTALRSGALAVVTNCYLLTEGWDLPAIECVILARGCGTAGMMLQMAGRGLRPSPGKTECVVLDLNGVTHDHGHVHDDRTYSLVGRGISEPGGDAPVVQAYCRVCKEPLDADCLVCPVCGTTREAPPQVVTGDALVPYQVVLARDAPDKRALRLAKWMQERKLDGTPKKESAAYHKYAACYQCNWPPSDVIAAARRIVREAQAQPVAEGWT